MILQENYLSKVERGTGTRNAKRSFVNIGLSYSEMSNCQIIVFVFL